MSKKIKIIFTLSFLLNILVLGVLLGGAYKMKNWHDPSSFSESTREVMRENIRMNRADMRQDFNKIREYKKDLKHIMTAEKFDKIAFEEKINQVFEIKNVISQRKAQTLSKTLSQLPQEERKAFSSHVLGQLMGKHPKGHQGRKYRYNKGN